jgi:hypothetical protein
MDVQHSATVVHLWQDPAHSGEIGYESFAGERAFFENYNIEKAGVFPDEIVPRRFY